MTEALLIQIRSLQSVLINELNNLRRICIPGCEDVKELWLVVSEMKERRVRTISSRSFSIRAWALLTASAYPCCAAAHSFELDVLRQSVQSLKDQQLQWHYDLWR